MEPHNKFDNIEIECPEIEHNLNVNSTVSAVQNELVVTEGNKIGQKRSSQHKSKHIDFRSKYVNKLRLRIEFTILPCVSFGFLSIILVCLQSLFVQLTGLFRNFHKRFRTAHSTEYYSNFCNTHVFLEFPSNAVIIDCFR